ncbi:FAD-binding domain-containing protein [Acephala macrosclerotiorum]|nr:FAD-binding domain-containing protein [Acephala macrosclerotiorum]
MDNNVSPAINAAIIKSLAPFTDADVEELKGSLSEGARVARPEDSFYDKGIERWSTAAQKLASIVAFPKTPSDVSQAVLFSIKHGLELAVCGGGHSTSGSSSTQGGLCINLSGMRKVEVNAWDKTVTAEGGALWKDVDVEAGKFKLAVVGGTVNHTGIGGLTLGGGYSYLTPAHGLTIDNLLSVEFVLADGSITTVSHTENPDLFWAARGAGTSFGVATKFTYQAHDQLDNVWAAKIVFDMSGFAPIIDFANNLLEKKDPKSWLFVGSGHMPPKPDTPSILCICFYNGTDEEAMSVFGPLLKLKEHVIYSHCHLMPYSEVNGLINDACAHGHRRTMSGCAFIPSQERSRELAWESFNSLKQFVKRCPDASHSFVLLEFIPFDKVCEVAQTSTAFANRGAYCNLLYIMCWDAPESDQPVRDFVREQVQAARIQFLEDRIKLRQEGAIDPETASSVGEYFNHDTNSSDVDGSTAFGPNYNRLVELKRRYDPQNVFCKGPNLMPRIQNQGSSAVI